MNESEIIIFVRQVWWSAEKERILGGEERKTKLRERGGMVSVKTDLTLFIARILKTYYLLYLFIFIIL